MSEQTSIETVVKSDNVAVSVIIVNYKLYDNVDVSYELSPPLECSSCLLDTTTYNSHSCVLGMQYSILGLQLQVVNFVSLSKWQKNIHLIFV